MEELGESIFQLGVMLLPTSFWAFIILRFLLYFWRWENRYELLIKVLWYSIAGIATFEQLAELTVILGYIAFIEAYDHLFQFMEKRREEKIIH
jgi:hypothetical protein